MTAYEAAKQLKCSYLTVWRRIKRGTVSAKTTNGVYTLTAAQVKKIGSTIQTKAKKTTKKKGRK